MVTKKTNSKKSDCKGSRGAAGESRKEADRERGKGDAGRLHPPGSAPEGIGGGAAGGDQSDMDRTGEGIRLRRIGYSPLPSQRKFHDSAARFKGFSGPIGSGKSQALCQEAIKLSYLNPGRQGLIGAPTYPMLRDATLTTFLEVLAANDLPYEFNKAESVLVMKDTGSRIYFRAVDEFERL